MDHQFGARLRELRRERGWKQAEVERALTLGPGVVSQYERGLREPGFDLLLALADLFGVTVDYLLGRPGAQREWPGRRPSA
jgi:transcriptional regulator with XRE-family HTH domain